MIAAPGGGPPGEFCLVFKAVGLQFTQLLHHMGHIHPLHHGVDDLFAFFRAVGTEEGIDVDLAVEERQSGDLWLICSDGLHGLVKDAQMEAILSVNTAEAAAKLLMDAALAAGGRDNISVVLVQDGEVAR